MPTPLERIFERSTRLSAPPDFTRAAMTPGVDRSFWNGPARPVNPQDTLTRAIFTADSHNPVDLRWYNDIYEYRFGEEENKQGSTFNEVDGNVAFHTAIITEVSLGGGGPNDYIYSAEADDGSGVFINDASPKPRVFGQNITIIPCAVNDICFISVGNLTGTRLIQVTEQYNLEPICPEE